MLYEETSGVSGSEIFDQSSFINSAWGQSWLISWGFSWGFVLDTPFADSQGSNPDDIFGEDNIALGPIFLETSGSQPAIIYEEN